MRKDFLKKLPLWCLLFLCFAFLGNGIAAQAASARPKIVLTEAMSDDREYPKGAPVLDTSVVYLDSLADSEHAMVDFSKTAYADREKFPIESAKWSISGSAARLISLPDNETSRFEPRRTGSFTLKCTVKLANGKSWKLSRKFTVKKSSKAVKKATLNGVTIASVPTDTDTFHRIRGTSARLNLTLNSGWRVKRITLQKMSDPHNADIATFATARNNRTYRLGKCGTWYLVLLEKKSDRSQVYYLYGVSGNAKQTTISYGAMKKKKTTFRFTGEYPIYSANFVYNPSKANGSISYKPDGPEITFRHKYGLILALQKQFGKPNVTTKNGKIIVNCSTYIKKVSVSNAGAKTSMTRLR